MSSKDVMERAKGWNTFWHCRGGCLAHYTTKMLDRKYLHVDIFLISFGTIAPIPKTHVKVLMQTPLLISNVVKIVFYRLAHRILANQMVDLYNVGTSTIWKYIAMLCEVLAIHDKLFGNYISTFITQIMCGQLWNFFKISLDCNIL